MCCGVSKSGSPAAKLQTSWPAAARALAFASTASVGEGAMLRAQVERGGRGEDGIVSRGAHYKGSPAPNASGELLNCPIPPRPMAPSAGPGFFRRKAVEREPQQLANARVFLFGEALEHRPLVGAEAHRNLPVRVARRLAILKVKLVDRQAHNLARRL